MTIISDEENKEAFCRLEFLEQGGTAAYKILSKKRMPCGTIRRGFMNNYSKLLKDPNFLEDHLKIMTRRWVIKSGKLLYNPRTQYPVRPDREGYPDIYTLWVLAVIKEGEDDWGRPYKYSDYRYYDTLAELEGYKVLAQID